MTTQPIRIAIVSNTAWSIANFRGGLISALKSRRFDVVAIAPEDAHVQDIVSMGASYRHLPMDNMGLNPFKDIALIIRLFAVLGKEQPHVVLSFTVKPNIYGGIAARLLRIPIVSNVAGLGTPFIRSSWLTKIVEFLYRVGLHGAHRVFFQNDDDKAHFLEKRIVRGTVAERLPGSGVNTRWFAPPSDTGRTQGCPSPNSSTPESSHSTCSQAVQIKSQLACRFLLSARLLWDKGIKEYVEAARNLRQRYPNAEFQLLGFLGSKNRTAISPEQIDEWVKEGTIEYLGAVGDVRPTIAQADCIVLPSYREGLPRSLLEAASMAKPIIASDTAGCRDVVDPGVTGFLCRPRDAHDLANVMEKMICLPPQDRDAMGKASRRKMIAEFDERFVVDRYVEVVQELVRPRLA